MKKWIIFLYLSGPFSFATEPGLEKINNEQTRQNLYGVLLLVFDSYSSDFENRLKEINFKKDSFKISQSVYSDVTNPSRKVFVNQYGENSKVYVNEIESILFSDENFYYYVNPKIGIFTVCETSPEKEMSCKTVSTDQCEKKPFEKANLEGYNALAVATLQSQMGLKKTHIGNSASPSDIKRICDFEIKQIQTYRADKKHLYSDIKKLEKIKTKPPANKKGTSP